MGDQYNNPYQQGGGQQGENVNQQYQRPISNQMMYYQLQQNQQFQPVGNQRFMTQPAMVQPQQSQGFIS
jgi:hypothetical protein